MGWVLGFISVLISIWGVGVGLHVLLGLSVGGEAFFREL